MFLACHMNSRWVQRGVSPFQKWGHKYGCDHLSILIVARLLSVQISNPYVNLFAFQDLHGMCALNICNHEF